MIMKNYDESSQINHNLSCLHIPDHTYRVLIIGGSGSGKTIVLLNLIIQKRPNNDRMCLFFKDPFESMYQLLSKEEKNQG